MKKLQILVILLGLFSSGFAQVDGTLDDTFLPNNDGEKGANRSVFAAAEQTDGKILLGGEFSRYNSIFRRILVRINPDGSMDEAFNQVEFNQFGKVRDILIQPDGKILVAGDFRVDIDADDDGINDFQIRDLIRLNPDGSRDTTFLPNITATVSCGEIFSIALQDDNKIVVGGDIDNCFGDSGNTHLYRLEADGTIDTTFTGISITDDAPGV